MKKYLLLAAVLFTVNLGLISCSDDDDKKENNNPGEDVYKDKKYGNAAIDACNELANALTQANSAISGSKVSEYESELKSIIANDVDNVIVPTYTNLADDTESLLKNLQGLNVNTLSQSAIDKACSDFKKARSHWELSEAFLGGAASDFDVDPTIDSWPLNRSLLVSYLSSGRTDFTDEELDDASILGFHALEFILFRNGSPRKLNEFKGNDTYKGFEKVSGASELAYAQRICQLLYERTCQLQVAWEGATDANASRMQLVKSAGLEYETSKGYSYGENMKQAGNTSVSTFPTVVSAVTQLLSADEGSCVGITDEVGNAKIANPFSSGDVSYVESPFSHNSITDFQDNIRSVRNIWLGSLNGKSSSNSFSKFFENHSTSRGRTVEDAYISTIAKIGAMPAPFVKYVSTIWGVAYEDSELKD
jgi:hypothetical protein